MAGNDCCRRHITVSVQPHVTETEQRLQHRLSSSFALYLNFCLCARCEMTYVRLMAFMSNSPSGTNYSIIVKQLFSGSCN